MNSTEKLIFKGDEGRRLDSFLASLYSEYSRKAFENEIKDGNIKINGKIAKKSQKLEQGDVIEFTLPEPSETPMPRPLQMDLEIIYEDDELLVINKPANLTVHIGSGIRVPTLVDGLLFHTKGKLSSVNDAQRPGIVHRIDKDTSGLLVVAKTNEAHISLAEQLKDHSVIRFYFALVKGHFKEKEGCIESFLIRDPKNRLKRKSLEKSDGIKGKKAITHWKVLENFGKYSYLMLKLETGRTHQIRVHMASMNHALIGDQLYGSGKKELGVERQMLHAGILGFNHPKTGEYMEFNVSPPEDFLNLLEKLRNFMEA